MGLQSAMTTALTGLQAAETSIDIIGNNIANSNTVGFKASEVVFATQFLQTQSIGSAPSGASGGTNPRQIGLGVKVAQIGPDFSQGTIEISANPLDLAIQGDGFLLVQGGQGEQLFTRNGQLTLNSQNEVVTSTGNRLLGYGVTNFELNSAIEPITIPLGAERVAQSTSTAIFQGVLNPTVDVGGTPEIATSEVLGDASAPFPTDTDLTATEREAPGIGSASIDAATPGLDGGTYRYRVAFRESTAEAGANTTSPSVEWTVPSVPAGQSIDINTLPSPPAPYDQIVLYRTIGDGADFYELDVFSAGVTLPIDDTTSDADLVTNAGGVVYNPTAIDAGTYNYYVTYYNDSTLDESRPSVQFGNIPLDDNSGSIRLDLAALDPPPTGTASNGFEYNKVRIYRNLAGTTEFRLLDELDAPTTSAPLGAYIDDTPSSSIATNDLIDLDGIKASGGSLLVNLRTRNGNTYSPVFDLDGAATAELTFAGEKAGSTLDTLSLTIDSTTTVDTLLGFMYDALGLEQTSNVTGFPLPPDPSIENANVSISDGVIRVVSNLGEENAIDIPLTAFRLQPEGQAVTDSIDVVFSQSQAALGPGTTSEFLVYDSLGSPLTVRLTTVLEETDGSSTTYRWYASSADSNRTPPEQTTVVGNGVLQFDQRGDLQSSPSSRISIFRELTASESPLEIDLDFSSVTALAETDATGNPTSSLSMTSQDGFPPGVLTDFIITESGVIQGQFSNGTQRTLGQVVMARFANSQGLQQIGDSLYAESVNSGEAIIGDPGADGLGSLTAGAVELSNSDIGQDLVEMILAQTQYQAGSRVISAAQELLDELLALQR